MDATRFDHLAQSLHEVSTRRVMARGLAGAIPGIALMGLPSAISAKKKKKKTKLTLNAFGCVDVGQNCAGNSVNCCSGICQGNKPKQGKKDKSLCVAHNADICSAVNDSCVVGVTVSCGGANPNCRCVLTTGNAGFCTDTAVPATTLCRLCKKDTDCEPEFGAGTACIVLGDACSPLCPATGGTACFPPTACA